MTDAQWSACSLNGIPLLTCIPPLVTNLINWALVFAGVVAFFLLIFSGYKFISSGGDPKNVEGAKKTATYAIAGLILILLSFFIVRTIGQITGLESDCINLFGFTNCN
ncbi:MAG: hypothetical protein COU25_01070 [Candidatus Levybacteria bacterium CG10_big_fil_rev_8_21_14_0_10_35_13]|nr:MAG: hypothetical protein COU25_01070 [Candidatus Levybacteria bacterium CG10_big_fil_rev_8_21_14_0_10_35_13]